MFNSFGNLLRLTTFGESHGQAIGGVIDGYPSGVKIDVDFVQEELNRRRPGQSAITTSRNEGDKVNFLSGIFEGRSTGAPIGFVVSNEDQRSDDYSAMKYVHRPSHADFVYRSKYGIYDHRGGGRASARETVARVVGGALAKIALSKINISIHAYTSQIGNISMEGHYKDYDLEDAECNAVRCPDPKKAAEMERYIAQVQKEGDTIGGIVGCVIKGSPIGLGQPVFGKLHAQLGAAMLSINAAKGFEYGSGFRSVDKKGSELNDLFFKDKGSIRTHTNHSGGIQGGISNGQDIFFRVAFKPVATIGLEQETVTVDGKKTTIKGHGRHDPCVVPRAVPIVEAMAAMTILDFHMYEFARELFFDR
ncbi:MAG: chorismate synthase [Mediterranea sp.]|jgi:chorismate synthase|nr:chorismate synthase [Mediterranea sp.]